MVKVCFEYDERVRKWEVVVEGAVSPKEAIQAFNAVVITLRDAPLHTYQAEPIDADADNKFRLDFYLKETTT